MTRNDRGTIHEGLWRRLYSSATSPIQGAGVSDPRLAAGALALVASGGLLVARTTLNARLLPEVAGSMGVLWLAAVVVPAISALTVALTTSDSVERIGLAFVGTFGLLAVVAPAAVVPAVAAIVGGGVVAVGARWETLPARTSDWHLLPAVLLLAAVAVSLIGAVGFEPTTLWPVGSHLALLGAATTPALLGHGQADWAFGGVVAALLFALGTTAPFLTGAITLVSGGVVGASLLVVSVGLCGIVTTASAALRSRHWHGLVGVGLVFAGGVPTTIPRALAVVLGVLLLVEPLDGGVQR